MMHKGLSREMHASMAGMGPSLQDSEQMCGDCRDGSRVFVDYRAQFSGEKHPTAAGGGFQQAKRGRKAQRDAPPARAAEAAHAQGSSMGHWMTTHVQGRRRKVGILSDCNGSACPFLERCLSFGHCHTSTLLR